MSNLIMMNAVICMVGFGIGVYTFIRHLKAFSTAKTPSVDAWLVTVGMLGWSIMLYASFDDYAMTHLEIFSRALILIYWVGDILKVQKHCLKVRRLKRQ